MAASASNYLRVPGEDAQEWWTTDGVGAWKSASEHRNATGCTVAVECLAMDSAPFWSVASPDSAIDSTELVALHWEAMGVDTSGDGRNWCYWQAGEEQGRALIATMALAPEAPEEEWIALLPEVFEPSALLFPIPPRECAIWKELGRFVVAFPYGERLLHVAVLNSRVLNAEAAHEIRDLVQALEARGLLDSLEGCRVWTAAEADFAEALDQACALKVREEAKPAPRLPTTPSGLLPASIVRVRAEKARHAQQMRLIATLGLACVAFFASWIGWLWIRDQRAEHRHAELALHEPQVQMVRNAQLKWAALEPAVEPDIYPVEIFHQIVSLLPPQGVQLQEFAFEPEKLVLSGIATTATHALKLEESIKHCEPLQRYTWIFPPAGIKEDNRATFRWEAALAGGASHEGE